MPLYVIERKFADQLDLTADDVRAIDAVNADEGVSWLFSFITADKLRTYCLYEAPSPDAIIEAARRANVPADKIVEVSKFVPAEMLACLFQPGGFRRSIPACGGGRSLKASPAAPQLPASARLTLRRVAWDVLSEEQRELRELVRTLARERIAPRAAEIDASHEFPWDVVELFREQGIFGLFFDEDVGGTGTGTLLSLVAIEEVSKVCATSGLILAVQELGSLGLKLGGSDEQRAAWLPRLASGEVLAAYALTEAGSGSDSAAMRTVARRDNGEYVLDGTKRFITNAGVAGLYTVFAKTDPDGGHAGISAFLVEPDTPGFEVARLEEKMGIAGSTTGELVFDGCRVPEANRLGAEGDRLQARDADPRPLAAGRGGAGARHRAGSDRLRARVRADARDDGEADRGASADRGEARRHGDEDGGGARAALPLRPDGRRRRP